MEQVESYLMGTREERGWVRSQILALSIGPRVASVGISTFAFLGIQFYEVTDRLLGHGSINTCGTD